MFIIIYIDIDIDIYKIYTTSQSKYKNLEGKSTIFSTNKEGI